MTHYTCSYWASKGPTDPLETHINPLEIPTDPLDTHTDPLKAPTDPQEAPNDTLKAPAGHLKAPTAWSLSTSGVKNSYTIVL